MRTFVIVVDMQRDFVLASGALPVPDAEALIAPMQAWLAGLKPGGVAGVLMTFDTHDPNVYATSPEGAEFPIHCVRDTPGWDLVFDPGAIDPAIPLYRLEKGVFDMWAEPDPAVEDMRAPTRITRDAFFARLASEGIETVTVAGVAADYCVRWAIDGLVARGFAVAVPVALTRGIFKGMTQVVAEEFGAGDVRLVEAAPLSARIFGTDGLT